MSEDEEDRAGSKISDLPSLHARQRKETRRGSQVTVVDFFDEEEGTWRSEIRMRREMFDDLAKDRFLREFMKWGRMGEAARAAGVTPQTVNEHMKKDHEFAEAMLFAESYYKDKLISHHQNLVFEGQTKKTYDRNGNLVSEEQIFPIRLIELELKKHDPAYRDKQEVAVSHTGGVLLAPAEMGSIDDWKKRFAEMKTIDGEVTRTERSKDDDDDR